MVRYFIGLGVFFLCLLQAQGTAEAQTAIPEDKKSAVIYAYHRIGEDRFPDTNIRRTQFEEHIRELKNGPYHIAALPDVINAFEKNKNLPDRTIVLTFDGGHDSITQYAVPLLLDHEIPFTLFLPTDHIDRNDGPYMSWEKLRKLAKSDLVSFGIHPANYGRLYTEPRDKIIYQINKARSRFREEMGFEPTFFAYPYGEYSAAYRDIIREQGFKAAFSQNSGVAYAGADMHTLPRFPMTESYGTLSRFRLTAHALPLPVTDLNPADPHLNTAKPDIGFSIHSGLSDYIDKISCFAAHQDKPATETAGNNRVELRLQAPFEHGRARVNCTMAVPPENSLEETRWRWLGMLFTTPAQHERLREYSASEDSRSPF